VNNGRRAAFRCLTAIVLAAVGVASIVASGGGGGGGGEGSTSAQGLWRGTTDADRSMFGVVLDDGSYWFVYTVILGPVLIGPDFIQGTGMTSGNDFSSSDGRDFRGDAPTSFTFAGNFAEKGTLDGTFTYPESSEVLNAAYDDAYDLAPSLVNVAGTYAGFANGNDAMFVISAAGTIDGSEFGGCNGFQGTIAPHAAGNVYDVTGTIFQVDCVPDATRAVSGIALFDADTIHLMMVDSERMHGHLFTGSLQESDEL
jgi:hypothetical protein